MAGAIHKMAVYLGLVEDDVAYDDGYDSYEEEYDPSYEEEDGAEPDVARSQAPPARNGHRADAVAVEPSPPAVTSQVIMNLTEMVDSDAKRLVDFAAGLVFGLRGSIDRVTNRVFLLSPASIEVTAEDKARIAERGFFNQS